MKKPKNEMDNLDFAFFRAIRRIKQGTYQFAINQLKQVLD